MRTRIDRARHLDIAAIHRLRAPIVYHFRCDLRMKLDPINFLPPSIRLVSALFRIGQQLRAFRQIERFAVPVKKRLRRWHPAKQPVRLPLLGQPNRLPTDLQFGIPKDRAPSALAIIWDPRQIPSMGTSSFSAFSIRRISLRSPGKSSLADIGPPIIITAPYPSRGNVSSKS